MVLEAKAARALHGEMNPSTERKQSRQIWRRGSDLNRRMEVLQTSPLGLLGTAPELRSIAKLASTCQWPHGIMKF